MTSAAWQSSLGPHGELWTLRVVSGASQVTVGAGSEGGLGDVTPGMCDDIPRTQEVHIILCELPLHRMGGGKGKAWGCYPKTEHPSRWVWNQKTQPSQNQEKEGFIICSKYGKHKGPFPKQCFPNSRTGEALISGHMHIHGGGGGNAWVVHAYS